MRDLYLDILKIGRHNEISFESLKESLVSKGYEWTEVQDATKLWFNESFEPAGYQFYILKAEVTRWLRDYEAKKKGNLAIRLIGIILFIIVLIFFIIGIKLLRKPKVSPPARIKGFSNNDM